MKRTNINYALEAAQELTVVLYAALREELSRDYQLAAALQRPCFSLISSLAAASATPNMRYRERRCDMAIISIAQFTALINTSLKAQAIADETHSILLKKIQMVQAALNLP